MIFIPASSQASPELLQEPPPPPEPTEYMLRTPPPTSAGTLEELVRGATVARVQDCVLQTAGAGVRVQEAFRAKQRMMGEDPPQLLPICVSRWEGVGDPMAASTSATKVCRTIRAPLGGLRVSLAAPGPHSFVLEELEVWSYNLRSFLVPTIDEDICIHVPAV